MRFETDPSQVPVPVSDAVPLVAAAVLRELASVLESTLPAGAVVERWDLLHWLRRSANGFAAQCPAGTPTADADRRAWLEALPIGTAMLLRTRPDGPHLCVALKIGSRQSRGANTWAATSGRTLSDQHVLMLDPVLLVPTPVQIAALTGTDQVSDVSNSGHGTLRDIPTSAAGPAAILGARGEEADRGDV
ncbi:hypothetical protein [Cellulosimicrobium protaetiae]